MQTEILDHQSFSDHYPVLLRRAIINTEDESKIVRDTSFLRYPSIVEKYLFVLSDKTFSKLSNSGISSFTAFYEVFLAVTEHYAQFKQIRAKRTLRLNGLTISRKIYVLNATWLIVNGKEIHLIYLCYIGSKKFEFVLKEMSNQRSGFTIKNMFDNCLGDSRKTFPLFNELSGKTRSNNSFIKLASCISDTKPIPSNFEVAEKFNEFFVSIEENIKHSIPSEPIELPSDVNMSIRMNPVSETQAIDIINSLPNKSSSGEDEISNILVKTAGSMITKYRTSWINVSFYEGSFTSELKKANVFPLFKNGSRVEENNYRPISLLNVLSKIYERAMFTRVYEYL